MNIKNQMDRLQYKKGGLIKFLIEKGDTLFSIADKNNLSMAELLELNPQIKNPDMIYAGDNVFIPGKNTEVEDKQESLLSMFRKKAKKIGSRIKKPESKTEKDLINFAQESGINIDNETIQEIKKGNTKERVIPLFIRQYIYDTFGGNDDITAEDFNAAEYKALQDAARSSLKAGKKQINYDTFRDVGASPGDVRTRGEFGFNNPVDSVQLTLGQANIDINDQGEIYAKDQYNWNDAGGNRYKGGLFNEQGLMPLTESTSPKNLIYRFARNFKTLTGRGEGEGSKVNVYLGNTKDFL
jgi:hypothetical protein